MSLVFCIESYFQKDNHFSWILKPTCLAGCFKVWGWHSLRFSMNSVAFPPQIHPTHPTSVSSSWRLNQPIWKNMRKWIWIPFSSSCGVNIPKIFEADVIQSDRFIPYLEVTNNLWRGHVNSPSQNGHKELSGRLPMKVLQCLFFLQSFLLFTKKSKHWSEGVTNEILPGARHKTVFYKNNMLVKLDHFPNFRGENKKSFKPPPIAFTP